MVNLLRFAKPHMPSLFLLVATALLSACSERSTSPAVSTSGDDIVGGEQVNLHHSPLGNTVLRLILVDKVEEHGMPSIRKSNCTGTLIASNLILTAGHCVETILGKRLYPMLINRETGKAHSKGMPVMVAGQAIDRAAISVSEVAVPPGFSSKNGLTKPDIALLKLRTPIKLSRRTPRPKLDLHGLEKPGRRLLAMGFGATEIDPENPETHRTQGLQKKTFTVTSASKVNWRKSRKLADQFFLRTERWQKKGNLCVGDSGGPIFLKGKSQYYLVGITARSERDCEGVSAATSVAHHAKWIRRQAAKWQAELF